MARTVMTSQKVPINGLAPSYTGVAVIADGFSFPNVPSNKILHLKNTGTGTATVTIQTPGKLGGVSLTAPNFTIAQAADKFVSGFDPAACNQADGTVNVDVSGTTAMTVAVMDH